METEWFGNVAKQSAASCTRMHKATVGNLGAGKAGYEMNLSGLEASRLSLEAGTSLVTSRCHRRFAVTGAQHLGHAPKPWPCSLELPLLPWMEPASNSHTTGNPWPLSSAIPAQCCSLANKFVFSTPGGCSKQLCFFRASAPHTQRGHLWEGLSLQWKCNLAKIPKSQSTEPISDFRAAQACLTAWTVARKRTFSLLLHCSLGGSVFCLPSQAAAGCL